MIACYARVSTQEQALHGNSIEEQTERMRKYCEAMDWSPVKVYTDAGYSGSSVNRPALQNLIRDISNCKITRVVVYKLDRLSRSQKDTLYLIEDVFLANHVDFVSMSENFDTSSAFGIAMVGILAVFAQLERQQIKERMEMGRIARAKKGLYSGSWLAPTGYDYQDGKLSVNEFEAVQIREIFDQYCSGKSLQSIANSLNRRGLYHKYGKWNYKTVQRILDRRLYLGEIAFNGIQAKGVHEPIISVDQFNLAQARRALLKQEEQKNNIRHGKASTYLAGLLHCKQCGQKYWLRTVHKGDQSYRYYVCNGKERLHNCHNRNWRVEDLDRIIFDEIRKLSIDPTLLEEEQTKDNSSAITKEIERIDEQISRLIDLYSVGSIPIEDIQTRVEDLDRKKDLLSDELESINERMTSDEVMALVTSFSDALELGTFDGIRELLFSLIDRIELDGDDIDIHWNFC